MNFLKILTLITVLLMYSCNKINVPNNISYDYSYFPTDSGKWVEYKVTQIHIDKPTNKYDTIKYQLLYKWNGLYTDATNSNMYKLSRFIKTNNKWKPINSWYGNSVKNKAIMVEDNIKYVKLQYPLKIGNSWNGNIYNNTDTLNNFMYTVKNIKENETINGISFKSVVTVNQQDFNSEVEKYFYEEKYAKNIGLIKKEVISVYSNIINPNIPIEKRITKGSIFIMEIENLN